MPGRRHSCCRSSSAVLAIGVSHCRVGTGFHRRHVRRSHDRARAVAVPMERDHETRSPAVAPAEISPSSPRHRRSIDFPGATFSMAPLVGMNIGGGVVQFGPGSIQFFDSAINSSSTSPSPSAIIEHVALLRRSDFIQFNVDFTGSMDMETEVRPSPFPSPTPPRRRTASTSPRLSRSSADRFIPTPAARSPVSAASMSSAANAADAGTVSGLERHRSIQPTSAQAPGSTSRSLF